MEIDFRNYQTVSEAVKGQISDVVEVWKKHMGKNLLGIYLHGSMALECFSENSSDIDILAVTDRKIPRAERLVIAQDIMMIDRKPCPLEMSALYIRDIKPWQYPTRCQFHYSDYWTEHYEKLQGGEITESFIVDTDFEDTDIACHIKLTKQCGICVYGGTASEIFPDVPEEDFWASISSEVEDYDFHAYNPKYFVSNILILGRILSYKKEKIILSKYDGGIWTRDHVPEKYRYIIDNALQVWYLGQEQAEYKREDLEGLRQYLIDYVREH